MLVADGLGGMADEGQGRARPVAAAVLLDPRQVAAGIEPRAPVQWRVKGGECLHHLAGEAQRCQVLPESVAGRRRR